MSTNYYISLAIGLTFSIMVVFRMFLSFIKNPFTFFRKIRHDRPHELVQNSTWMHKYLQLKDVKIHYVEAGSADKPLMLFIHGFPEFWYSWRHQITEFKKDYRVIAVDQRGYGDSDKPIGMENYTMTKLTGDVKELVESLGHDKCILVGHDWGAAVAWTFSYLYPETVDKLVIMNVPHSSVFTSYLSKHFSQFMKSWYIFFFQLPWLPEIFLSTQDCKIFDDIFGESFDEKFSNMGMKMNKMSHQDIETYKYTFTQPDAWTGPVNYYRAAFRMTPLKVGQITVPVLIIWGDQDGALEKDMGSLSVGMCNDATLKFVEGSSHWVQQDAPDIVNQHMRNFLSR